MVHNHKTKIKILSLKKKEKMHKYVGMHFTANSRCLELVSWAQQSKWVQYYQIGGSSSLSHQPFFVSLARLPGFFVARNSMIRTSKYKDFKVLNNYEEKSFKCRHSFKLVGNTFRSKRKYQMVKCVAHEDFHGRSASLQRLEYESELGSVWMNESLRGT